MNKKFLFKLYFKPDRLFLFSIAVAVAFIIVCSCGFLNITPQKYILLSLIFIAFSLIRFEFAETAAFDLLIPLVHSFVLTLIIQIMGASSPLLLGFRNLIANTLLNAGITYLFLLITNRLKLSVTISHVLLSGFAFIDYLVKSFRGGVNIKISDFYSIRTAVSVANQYKPEMTTQVTAGLVIAVIILYVLWITKLRRPASGTQTPRKVSAVCLAVSVLYLFICLNFTENRIYPWGSSGFKQNGLTYNLLIEAKNYRVEVPEGYSDEKAQKILSAYTDDTQTQDSPHIIAIMSEAFSDLTVLGDFKTNKNPMEFYSSLSENCTKGYVTASVLGGNTATSEWEFLTGNTQAFMPAGSVAYQQYIKENPNTIVDIMKDNGYTTVAMHPYKIGGWQRSRVYKLFGFDELYFDEQLSDDVTFRGYVSDETFFRDIIKRFEARKENEKLFTFAVTMQNHGGYKLNTLTPEVTVDGVNAPDTEQYLTLIDKSDDAFKELISYFEKCDEKVMIVLFGDHQPILDDEFYDYVMNPQLSDYEKTLLKHTVPFIIWTNYDTEEDIGVSSSINFLPAMMMKKAGIELTPYFSYLYSLKDKIPAISANGYFSESERKTKDLSNADGNELTLINEYRTVQYKNIFAP